MICSSLMHTPGDRKNATARVWVKKGSGNVTVNEVPFVKYFPRMEDRYGICIQLFCRLYWAVDGSSIYNRS